MSEPTTTFERHETKVRDLREQLAAKRAEQDQRVARREACEEREKEIERLNVLVDLGELDPAEAAAQKAEIAAEIDDARQAEKTGAAAVEELERRVEAAGDAWAEAVKKGPYAAAYRAQQDRLQAEAWLAEKHRIEAARRADLAKAEKEAQEIRDSCVETENAKWWLRERKNREYAAGTDALRKAMKGDQAAQEALRAGKYGDEFLRQFESRLADYLAREAAAEQARAPNAVGPASQASR